MTATVLHMADGTVFLLPHAAEMPAEEARDMVAELIHSSTMITVNAGSTQHAFVINPGCVAWAEVTP